MQRFRLHMTIAIIGVITLALFQNCSSGFRAIVSGSSTAASLSSHIGGNGDVPPQVSFTLSQASVAPDTMVTIDIMATAQVSNAMISKVDIYVDGTIVKTLTSAPFSYMLTEQNPANYTIQVAATDSLGGYTPAPAQTLTVQAPSGTGAACTSASYQAPAWSSGQMTSYSYNLGLPPDTMKLAEALSYSTSTTFPVNGLSIKITNGNKNLTINQTMSKSGQYGLTIQPNQNFQCASGTVTFTVQLQDECLQAIAGFNYPASSTKTFTLNYSNTCPAESQLVQTTPTAQEEMGSQVATDGSVVVMTAPQYSANGPQNTGAAYVFAASAPNNGSNNTDIALLSPSNVAGQKIYSAAVTNGVIALGTDPLPGVNGAVYIYKGSGSNWSLVATIPQPSVSNQSSLDPLEFGQSVAILNDGSIAVGAPGEDVHGLYEAGAVYIYSGSTYAQIAQLTAATPVQFENFGTSLSVNGSNLAIGAPYASYQESSSLNAVGSAYVFSGSSGSSLSQIGRAVLQGGKPSASDVYQFGQSVSINGSYLLVGAPLAGGGGMAYLYNKNGTYVGSIAESSQGTPSGDNFGQSVQIDSNNNIWIGAPSNSSEAGAIFKFSMGATNPNYTLVSQNIMNQPAYSTPSAKFGASFVVYGSDMVVGSPGFAGLDNGMSTYVNSGLGFIIATP